MMEKKVSTVSRKRPRPPRPFTTPSAMPLFVPFALMAAAAPLATAFWAMPTELTGVLRSSSAARREERWSMMATDGYVDATTAQPFPSSMPLRDYGSLETPRIPLGRVTLVGSGPGDPELLTVAAYRVLQEADLVIADRLVSPEILALIPGELRVANKHPGCQETAQREIYEWLEAGVLAGKHVARLKIGDPFVFGRGAEEVLHLRRYGRYGVSTKVIPGISSVFSAPLLAGIPVTHRDVANTVTLGTGYGKDSSRPDMLPYRSDTTAVFLMAVGRLPELTKDLLARGYPADCPVAIVENASTPRQRVLAGTVDTIVAVAAEHRARPPATIVVGDVVRVLHNSGVDGVVLQEREEGEGQAKEEQKAEASAVRLPPRPQPAVMST